MDLTWLGTAGFILKSTEVECAFDPFLSRRNPHSPSPFHPKSFANTHLILLGHGHFDHVADIESIALQTNASFIGAEDILKRWPSLEAQRKIPAHESRHSIDTRAKVYCFESRHIKFDLPLVLQTARHCGISGCLHVAGLGLRYPKGGVRSYYLELDGKKILFVSSAGCTDEELRKYRELKVDYFLAPLQGHSQIQSIAARMTAAIAPRIVIPHHYDDFYQPMSQEIPLDPFRFELKKKYFKGEILEIPLFQTQSL